jgi:hypothetical protein
MAKDQDHYLKLAETVSDKELAGYYRERASEAQYEDNREAIDGLTRAYLKGLRSYGVDLPEKASVQVQAED